MDKALKQRLVGATVLVALAVVILPMLLGGRPESPQEAQPIEIPPRPAELEFDGPRRFPIGDQATEGPSALPDRQIPPLDDGASDASAAGLNGAAPAAETMEQRLERIAAENAAAPGSPAGPAPNASPSVGDDAPTEGDGAPAPASDAATSDRASVVDTGSAPDAAAAEPPISDAAEPAQRAAPEPAIPPAPMDGRYVVQVASFSSTGNADRLAATLREGGIPVLMDTVDSAAGVLHRVRVGPFAQRAEAEQVMARLARQVPDVRPRLVDLRPDEETQVTEPDDPLVRWVVQVGVFSEAANAEKLVFRLRDAGFPAQSQSESSAGATVYRVRVGPEVSRAAALRLRDRIEAEQGIRGMVQSSD